MARRITEGKSKKEVMRCLKRYVAAEVYKLIVNPPVVPAVDDLRVLRQSKKMSLRVVAEHFNVDQVKVSRIERARARDDEFCARYREFLLEAA